MEGNKEYFLELLERFIRQEQLTQEQRSALSGFMADPENILLLEEKVFNDIIAAPPITTDEIQRDNAYAILQEGIKRNKVEVDRSKSFFNRFTFIRNMAAAVVIGALLIGGWLYITGKKQNDLKVKLAANHVTSPPIVPGKMGAILTLADGRQISLDSQANGLPSLVGGAKLVMSGGHLKFQNTGTTQNLVYNTLTTPAGRNYHFQLSDGTQVWLNASSSIRFPVVFSRSNRTVEVKGEAYFEVVHNQSAPFMVKVRNQLVEDLGTKFNVNAYSEDATVKTTLLQGAVSVVSSGKKVLLTPGQQLTANAALNTLKVSNVNTDNVIAWKEGFFVFSRETLKSVMDEVSRWYNVSVEYHENTGHQLFNGKIDKNIPLEDVLSALALTDGDFKIDLKGRKIMVNAKN